MFRLASATPSPEWWLNPCADRLGLIEVPPICGETSRGEGAAVEEADGPTETERGLVAGKRDLTGEVGCERARADMLEGECNGGPPLAAGTPFRLVVGGAKELDMGELAKTPAEWGGAGYEAEPRFSVWIAGAVVTDRNGTGRFPRENVLPEERLLDATAAEKALVAAEWSSGCPGVGKGELPVEFGTLWNTYVGSGECGKSCRGLMLVPRLPCGKGRWVERWAGRSVGGMTAKTEERAVFIIEERCRLCRPRVGESGARAGAARNVALGAIEGEEGCEGVGVSPGR